MTGWQLSGPAALVSVLAGTTIVAAAAQNRVVFTRDGGFGNQIFVANAEGSDESRLLGKTEHAYNPSWSPDGRWIAFTSERDGSADLYRIKPDGTGREALTSSDAFDDQAAWSPDAARIVFVTTRAGGTADLWTLDVKTKTARALTSGPGADLRPSWSPDGRWIAFSSDRDNGVRLQSGGFVQEQLADIYLVRPDGTNPRRLTKTGGFCGSPVWSRDSRRVMAACVSAAETVQYRVVSTSGVPPGPGNTRLEWIDIDTGETSDASSGAGIRISPRVLPGDLLAYVRLDAVDPGVFYGNGTRGPRSNEEGAVRTASWSPDGARVVYHRHASKLEPANNPDWRSLWSRLSQYELVHTKLLPAFDPSGQRFVTTDVRPGGRALLIGDAMKDATRRLFVPEGTQSAFAGQWSPRGDEVAFGVGTFFLNGQGRPAQIATIKADGSGYRELTTGANNNGFPSYSPDGARMVFRTQGADGQGLRIVRLSDGFVTTLTTEYDTFPAWSPTRDLIAFIRRVDGDFELFTIRPDGSGVRRLTSWPGNEGHPAWSPDGNSIVFASGRMGFKDEFFYTDCPQPYGELFVMRYDGTHMEQLTDNQWEDGGPTWPRRAP